MSEHDQAFLEMSPAASTAGPRRLPPAFAIRVGPESATAMPSRHSAASCRREDQQAFEAVVRDILTGLAHTIMVILDGGSAYSDNGSPQLFHSDGRRFPAGLNEWLLDHLGRTGRLP